MVGQDFLLYRTVAFVHVNVASVRELYEYQSDQI